MTEATPDTKGLDLAVLRDRAEKFIALGGNWDKRPVYNAAVVLSLLDRIDELQEENRLLRKAHDGSIEMARALMADEEPWEADYRAAVRELEKNNDDPGPIEVVPLYKER